METKTPPHIQKQLDKLETVESRLCALAATFMRVAKFKSIQDINPNHIITDITAEELNKQSADTILHQIKTEQEIAELCMSRTRWLMLHSSKIYFSENIMQAANNITAHIMGARIFHGACEKLLSDLITYKPDVNKDDLRKYSNKQSLINADIDRTNTALTHYSVGNVPTQEEKAQWHKQGPNLPHGIEGDKESYGVMAFTLASLHVTSSQHNNIRIQQLLTELKLKAPTTALDPQLFARMSVAADLIDKTDAAIESTKSYLLEARFFQPHLH